MDLTQFLVEVVLALLIKMIYLTVTLSKYRLQDIITLDSVQNDCYVVLVIVRFDASDGTWTCTLRMPLGWIIGFAIIACCGFCCLCGLFSLLFQKCCNEVQSVPPRGDDSEVLMASK